MGKYKKKTLEEKRKEVHELTSKMDEAIDKHFESPEKLREYLKYMGQFYNYSIGNSILIQQQFRGARAVGSFQFWKKKGYTVKKGETGIKILVPEKVQPKFKNEKGEWVLLKKATETEKRLIEEEKLKVIGGRTIFGVGHVFDVSQTTCPAKDLPEVFPNRWLEGELTNYDGFMNALQDVAQSIGVSIEAPRHELGMAKGAYYPLNHTISLNPRNSELENATTLIHELAHAKLHTKDKMFETSTSEKEFQAEMVSYAVSAYFGLENEQGEKERKSLSYLSHWVQGKELKEKSQLLKEVRETAVSFISTIEQTFSKEKNGERDNDSRLYWYEMLARPVDIGCQPKGFVDADETKGRHGLVAYSRPLSEKELEAYQMQKWSKKVYLIDMDQSLSRMDATALTLEAMKNLADNDSHSLREISDFVQEQQHLKEDDLIEKFNQTFKSRYYLLPKEQLTEPLVLIKLSESSHLKSSQLMKFTEANELFSELNKRLLSKEWYEKTRFAVLLPDQEGELDLISADRHDIGSGDYTDIYDQLKKDRLLNHQRNQLLSPYVSKTREFPLER